MNRVYNFSAGPSMLPVEVLEQCAAEMLDYNGSGMSVMEMSHRSKAYQQIIEDVARDRDYYKQERDEYRITIKQYDERINHLERAVARNGKMVEAMRPFMCGDLKCPNRIRGVKLEGVEVEQEPEQEPTETETA